MSDVASLSAALALNFELQVLLSQRTVRSLAAVLMPNNNLSLQYVLEHGLLC